MTRETTRFINDSCTTSFCLQQATIKQTRRLADVLSPTSVGVFSRQQTRLRMTRRFPDTARRQRRRLIRLPRPTTCILIQGEHTCPLHLHGELIGRPYTSTHVRPDHPDVRCRRKSSGAPLSVVNTEINLFHIICFREQGRPDRVERPGGRQIDK